MKVWRLVAVGVFVATLAGCGEDPPDDRSICRDIAAAVDKYRDGDLTPGQLTDRLRVIEASAEDVATPDVRNAAGSVARASVTGNAALGEAMLRVDDACSVPS